MKRLHNLGGWRTPCFQVNLLCKIQTKPNHPQKQIQCPEFLLHPYVSFEVEAARWMALWLQAPPQGPMCVTSTIITTQLLGPAGLARAPAHVHMSVPVDPRRKNRSLCLPCLNFLAQTFTQSRRVKLPQPTLSFSQARLIG